MGQESPVSQQGPRSGGGQESKHCSGEVLHQLLLTFLIYSVRMTGQNLGGYLRIPRVGNSVFHVDTVVIFSGSLCSRLLYGFLDGLCLCCQGIRFVFFVAEVEQGSILFVWLPWWFVTVSSRH